MPEQDIVSPPFPRGSPPAAQLYNTMQELRDWVLANREAVADAGQVPVPRELPELRVFTQLGVVTHFSHIAYLRQLREAWDHLVREYEDAWDCRACLQQRAVLVAGAAHFLNEAFLDNETREARAHTAIKRMQRFGERFQKFVERVMGDAGEDEYMQDDTDTGDFE